MKAICSSAWYSYEFSRDVNFDLNRIPKEAIDAIANEE
jgi:hypothetical protein